MLWWQNALVLGGLALQLAGTGLALRGIVATWHAYSRDPLVPSWGRFVRRFRESRARLPSFLGGRPLELHAADSCSFVETAVRSAAPIIWDAVSADHGEAIATLDERERELLEMVRKVEHSSLKAINQVRADLGLGLAAEAAQRAADIQAAATAGMTKAWRGLLVILTGIGLQAVAVLWMLLG